MNENEENIDEIRRDIEDTRHRISSEIDAIEGKLSPEHAKDVVMEKVQETRHRVADRIGGTAAMVRGRANSVANKVANSRIANSRVASDLGSAVRANPIPIALIGVGTGWLVWETMRPAKRELLVEPLVDLDVDVEPDYQTGAMGPIPADMRGGDGLSEHGEARKLAAARQRASAMASNARERAYGAKDRASHMAHDARDRASHMAHDARERSRIVAQKSRERAIRARERTTHSFESSPVAFGALALMAGIGFGLLMPHTRREDRMLGRSRDRVITRARRIADEAKDVAVDSVREGLREGTNAARETAKREAEERNLIR